MAVLERTANPIDTYAPDFELLGVDSQVHHLSRYLEKFRAVGVVFMSNRCHHVQLYLERLKKIQHLFQSQGFTLIGINPKDAVQQSNSSFEQIQGFAAQHQLNFPYLWDSTRDVTWSFGAQTTPTSFLIDRKGIIRYTGAIDDNAQSSVAAKRHYFRDAAMALLHGKKIQPVLTEPVGDLLK